MKKRDRGSLLTVLLVGAFAANSAAWAGPYSGPDNGHPTIERWNPHFLEFQGPHHAETDVGPNPFLDYRLQVVFEGPSGATYDVPGFFDGDGEGAGVGDRWKVRFAPDEPGLWNWEASFRTGTAVAISLDPDAGAPGYFDGVTGSFTCVKEPPGAEGFLAKGRLEYVGEHYLRFQDGSYFIKTGTNSPENLLGYSGFDNVQDVGGLPTGVIHDYEPHVADWNPGDPAAGAVGSPYGIRGLIGALNYLSEVGANAVYFLPMNMGGDGQETTPFIGYDKSYYTNTHYDVSRLEQWNTVMEHAMRKGIMLQFVLAETESDNEKWLDGGELGVERKLFFRELSARFGHHHALKWNLGEENDFSVGLLEDMAEYLLAVDPYGHPIGVHTHADDFADYFALEGNPSFSTTSIQYSNSLAGGYVEDWRGISADAGHPWVINLDENGTPWDGVSPTNEQEIRKTILYDTLFSGGNVEWYLGSKGLADGGGDQSLEDFRTRQNIWRYSRYARELMESELEFWDMSPADYLLSGESQDYGGGEVIAAGRDFAVYLPNATPSGSLDLSTTSADSRIMFRWFDPRNGNFAGPVRMVFGGGVEPLGAPPSLPGEDWVMLVTHLSFFANTEEVSLSIKKQKLFLDAGPGHAFETYQVLSSASGIMPGTWIDDLLLPINWDLFTTLSLTAPEVFSVGFQGTLDGNGRAVALVDGTGLLGPSTIGLSLDHAYLSGTDVPTFASNAVPMKVVP